MRRPAPTAPTPLHSRGRHDDDSSAGRPHAPSGPVDMPQREGDDVSDLGCVPGGGPLPHTRHDSADDEVFAVDVVLPTLDEAAALPWVLRRMPAGHRAIVVDNGSTDGSADVAREYGATVVTEPRRGFGAACAAGLAAVSADVVAFCDADASLDPQTLPDVTGPVLRGEADLVLGARRPTSRRAWPLHARLANRYLARHVRRTIGAPITDLGPMRAARRDDLLALGITDRRFGWPLEMVTRAAAEGWTIAEIPVAYAPREGRSKVTGTLTGTLRTVRDMRRVLRA